MCRTARLLVAVVLLLSSVVALPTLAAPPKPALPVQGVLRTSGGGPVADGVYALTFRLWPDVAADKPVFKEILVAVPVQGGAFTVALGTSDEANAIAADLFAKHPQAALSVQVAADPELPRVALLPVPYALHAATADSLAGGLTGDKLAPGSVPAAALGFAFAASDTKAGPALDLKCTGCVGLEELDPAVLDAKNVALTLGAKKSTVQAELGTVLQTLKIAGSSAGIAKTPGDLCAFDVSSDGGETCLDGAPALWTRFASNDGEMQQFAKDGQIVYRKDQGRSWVRAQGIWRRIAFDAVCGDGLVEGGEECDDGKANADAPDKCRTSCKKPACPDGIQDQGEQCDDGNLVPTDACVLCKSAFCGDGFVQPGEQCDDGAANANAPDQCRKTCKNPACGDGIADKAEGCDDGNLVGGDGCNGQCQPEITKRCAEYKAANPGAKSGVYDIDPDGAGGAAAYQVFCDMDTDGGGWTLVLSLNTADGNIATLNTPLWTTDKEFGAFATRWSKDYKSLAAQGLASGELLLVVRETVAAEGSPPKGWRSWYVDGSKTFNSFFTLPMGANNANATGGCNSGHAGAGWKLTTGIRSFGVAATYDTFTGFAQNVYSNSYYGNCDQDGFRLSSWYRWSNNANVGLGLQMDNNSQGPYSLEAGSHMKIDTYGGPQRYCTAGCGGCTAYADGSSSSSTTKAAIGTDHYSNHCTIGVSYRYEWYVK